MVNFADVLAENKAIIWKEVKNFHDDFENNSEERRDKPALCKTNFVY